MHQVFDRDQIIAANRFFLLSDRRMEELLALAAHATGDDAFLRQGEQAHELFFHSGLSAGEAAGRWQAEDAFPEDCRDAVAVLVVFSGLEHMMETYRARGIPQSYVADSLKDVSIWMDNYEERTGRTGLAELGWILRSLQGTLFRLGRLQFINGEFFREACAYRRADGAVVAFPAIELAFRSDGHADGSNEIYDPNAWKSLLEQSATEAAGTPIHPGGHAVNKTVRLPLDQWELCFRPGCGMLDIHIPKDGRMDLDCCRDSILQAMAFFSRYFPEKPYKLIHLATWFLDPQLQTMLPPESNIVRFQREFYLFPIQGVSYGCYDRVFGDPYIDITTAPEGTSLQRAVKRHVLAGHDMHGGAGFILPEDMASFGRAQYQTERARVLEELIEK